MTAPDPGQPPGPGSVVLSRPEPGGERRWILLREPVEVLQARRAEDVVPVIEAVESATERGLQAAGFVCYEAAPAFDPVLQTRSPGPLPLAWFGLYRKPEPLRLVRGEHRGYTCGEWQPTVSASRHREAVTRIKDAIARGDTYQVNYCFRLQSRFSGDPWALFQTLLWRQEVPHAAYVDLGDHVLCSASPELFFRLDGRRIHSRPMKGTAPRGLGLEDDERRARGLAGSAKERAENLMIVDMVRNDLGRVAATGSVKVPRLFEIEQYPTVWQMVSTVEAETDASLASIFGALFPCASITGAPKASTMNLLAELEDTPRGVYTGTIGWLGPGRQAELNVAIRTLWLDRTTGRAEYGTGSGVLWDSDAGAEYRECATKALVLTSERPDFRLLETLLWEADEGYFLLERHLERLLASARYFGFRAPDDLESQLRGQVLSFAKGARRVRVLLGADGTLELQDQELPEALPETWRVSLASQPVSSQDVFLYHKTTHRDVYDRARAASPDDDDVLLWNEQGEITESTLANVVLETGGELLTPAASCGLLPGTFRAHLLEKGEIREATLQKQDLERAKAVYLINSVRRWIPVVFQRREPGSLGETIRS